MKKVLLTAVCSALSLGLSACTVDAEMASNLLKSLQASVKDAETGEGDDSSLADVLSNLVEDTDSETENSLSADELNALLPAELAGYQLVCAGSGDMQIAAYREREQAVAPTPPQPARLRPQLVQMGTQPQAVNISVEIQTGLQRMAQVPAAERPGYYRDLQQRYPELRAAQPVTVARPGGQRDVVFAYPAQAAGVPAQTLMPGRTGQPAQAVAVPARTLLPGRTGQPAQAVRPVTRATRASGLVGCQLLPVGDE